MNALKLKNQTVRDLAWMLFSPPLITLPADSNIRVLWPLRDLGREPLADWLRGIDENPDALEAHLSTAKSPRLGIYFESLCAYFFSNYPGFTLIAQNLQVNRILGASEKKTLGEFDFIVQHQQQFLHIETAVKFYLGTGTAPQHNQTNFWIGPNANDRLDKKVGRLLDHQLVLADWPEGQEVLTKMKVPNVSKCLLMPGYLFYPERDTCPTPDDVHQDHNRGRWITFSRAISLLEQTASDKDQWCVLDKRLWLTLAKIKEGETSLQDAALMKETLKTYFSEQNAIDNSRIHALKKARLKHNPRLTHRPILLSQLVKEPEPTTAEPGYWHEQERYFVVPDYWPATAMPLRKT